jgi:hypothetical protein
MTPARKYLAKVFIWNYKNQIRYNKIFRVETRKTWDDSCPSIRLFLTNLIEKTNKTQRRVAPAEIKACEIVRCGHLFLITNFKAAGFLIPRLVEQKIKHCGWTQNTGEPRGKVFYSFTAARCIDFQSTRNTHRQSVFYFYVCVRERKNCVSIYFLWCPHVRQHQIIHQRNSTQFDANGALSHPPWEIFGITSSRSVADLPL